MIFLLNQFIHKCLHTFFSHYLLSKIEELEVRRVRHTSIVLGCFTFGVDKTKLTYLWNDFDLFKFPYSKRLSGDRILDAYRILKIDNLDYLAKRQYRLLFHEKNVDILDDTGRLLCRGSEKELDLFLFHNKLSLKEKKGLLIKDDSMVSGDVLSFRYDSRLQAELGENIPLSKFPGRAMSPDYSGTNFIHKINGKETIGKLQMTGYRKRDEKIMNELFFGPNSKTPSGYTWHHLDDVVVNSKGELSCTMQLVETYKHKRIIMKSLKIDGDTSDFLILNEHVGAVAIWKSFYYGVKYH